MKVCSVCRRCYDDLIYSCIDEDHPALSETGYADREIVAGYQVEALLESGPRGDLFRAGHTASGQSCLIRIMPVGNADNGAFLRDAQIAASLIHPNVTDIYEFGTLDGGELFVVSEDTAGRTLRELLDSSGVPDLLTTVRALRQVGEAVHAIHLKGLIHRALSPDNVIFGTDAYGRMQVRIRNIDLGGVMERSVVSNKFMIDSAIDLLRYFSPEQCVGETVSIRSDIYSLGIVLYEMLSGRPPFDAPKASGLIHMHRDQRPPEVRIDNFELRMLLAHTLMESLRKRPEKRQSSANAFARQLRHIEQLATHVSTPPPAGKVPPLPRRNVARVNVAVAQPAPVPAPAPMMAEALPASPAVQRLPVEQVSVEVVDEAPPVEVVVAASAVEIVDDVKPVESMDDARPEITQVVTESRTTGILPQECIAHVHQRLSRLKGRRKRSHAKPSAANPSEPEVEPVKHKPEVSVPEKAQAVAPSVMPVAARASTSAAAAGRPTPVRIEWEQPNDDVPSMADVLEELAKAPVSDLPSGPRVSAAPEPKVPAPVRKERKRVPAARKDPEEITVVTARPRPVIRVPVERSRDSRQRPSAHALMSQGPGETMFFPTLLGGGAKASAVYPTTVDSALSGFMPLSMPEIRLSSRSLMIGGGLLALVLLLLLGNSMLRQDPESADPVTARSQPQQPIATAPALADTQEPKKAVKAFDTPKSLESGTDVSKPSSGKAAGLPLVDRQQSTVARNGVKPASVAAGRDVLPGNAGTKANGQQEKRTAEKKPPATQNKPTATTRPRIVRNPKP